MWRIDCPTLIAEVYRQFRAGTVRSCFDPGALRNVTGSNRGAAPPTDVSEEMLAVGRCVRRDAERIRRLKKEVP
jgi:hypothetical protein